MKPIDIFIDSPQVANIVKLGYLKTYIIITFCLKFFSGFLTVLQYRPYSFLVSLVQLLLSIYVGVLIYVPNYSTETVISAKLIADSRLSAFEELRMQAIITAGTVYIWVNYAVEQIK